MKHCKCNWWVPVHFQKKYAGMLALSPGPSLCGEKGLVHTDCACATLSVDLLKNCPYTIAYCVALRSLAQTGARASLFIFAGQPTAWINYLSSSCDPWPYASRKKGWLNLKYLVYWIFYGNIWCTQIPGKNWCMWQLVCTRPFFLHSEGPGDKAI